MTLIDNGFGGKGNSPDAMLSVHRMTPDFKVPFPIAHEGTEGRYLTGAGGASADDGRSGAERAANGWDQRDLNHGQGLDGAGFKFALAEGATAIGDFNFVDATRAQVIERDNGEGDPVPDCFPLPAMVQRIMMINTAQIDADGFANGIGHIDLMTIADPDRKLRLETAAENEIILLSVPEFLAAK